MFHSVNLELNKVFEWFKLNKLSLNNDKTKYALFHEVRKKYNISLKLFSLFIGNKGNKITQVN